MALSAPGIGSGLDIKGIVSQLVELEKKPLAALEKVASSYQTKLSAFGQLKSQLANLQDQAAKLAKTDAWKGLSFSSSNAAAVSGSVNSATASATSFSVTVSQLAQAQATATSVMPTSQTFGAGQLNIRLGSWSGNNFTEGAAATVTVQVANGDSLATVASKINQANAGVTATVLHDGAGDRLLLKSNDTGVSQGFRVQTSGDASLEALRHDPPAAGMSLTQAGVDMQGTVNGVAVTSPNNKLDGAVTGVNLTFNQVTTGAVDIAIKADKASVRTNITNLVSSFNALGSALKEMTKYEVGTKTAGSLQGDATAVGLQSVLRRLFSDQGPGGGAYRRLSEVGVEFQLDGTLKVNESKLEAALNNLGDLKTFFAESSGLGGLAVRVESFAKGALKDTGTLGNRYKAIQSSIERNSREQERLNDKIQRTQDRLNAQYARLDSQLGKLNALSGYVNQQITNWNNQKG